MSGLDWYEMALNGLWVLGAAVIMAAFSLACYRTRSQGHKLRVALAAPGFQRGLAAGFVLIGLAATLIGPRWWERVLWGGICALGIVNFVATPREL